MLGRDFTSILDLDAESLAHVLDVSLGMKRDGAGPMLSGKTLALVFEKPSLRTRVSFEMAMQRLGGHTIALPPHEIQMGDREPVKDVARVLSRMVHGIAARTYDHETVLELVEHANVETIQGPDIQLRLVARAQASQLRATIELNQRLIPLEQTPASDQLSYQWQN